ncbi:hypothetical protein FHP26_17320 [Pseudomonas orientalis]|nr:hypothetical protein [Pseudomonas orientalis]
MGGGLPPIAECQSPHPWLIHRYREQAPSHIWISIYSVITHRYFLAMITARIGAGSPSMVLL